MSCLALAFPVCTSVFFWLSCGEQVSSSMSFYHDVLIKGARWPCTLDPLASTLLSPHQVLRLHLYATVLFKILLFFDAYILFTIKMVKSRSWGDSSFGKVLTMQDILQEDMNLFPRILVKVWVWWHSPVVLSAGDMERGISFGYSGQRTRPFPTEPFCWSLSLGLFYSFTITIDLLGLLFSLTIM